VKFDLFYQLPSVAGQQSEQRYAELIEEACEADRLGFHTLWLAEVHFMHRFSLLPAPMLLLAAIAQRTQRLKLGLAVNLLPLHHPVRLAEESATLDILSGGRLEFGAGRGSFTSNYRGYQVAMDESRERFVEGVEFVRQAWLQPRLTFEGRFFHVADLEVIPKPLQKPHPPIRIATNSPDTFSVAGSMGLPIFAAAGVNPPNIFNARLDRYRQAAAEANHVLPADWLAYQMMVFPGRDAQRVRQIVEPSMRHYMEVTTEFLEPQSPSPEHVAQLEKIKHRMRTTTYESIAANTALFGEPASCVDRITELQEQFGITRIGCWFEFGGLKGHREVIDAMRLFAGQVMPHFRATD
jgi:alkanesulfonate monooxygenase SsuD/methylene tetrahydromethanopterin reductase-like flavin-dependent oxidoreductase (luciferase family)